MAAVGILGEDWEDKYPDVSEMQTVPVDTVCPDCLRDVRCDGDDERDGDVLEYEDPGPLITKRQLRQYRPGLQNGAELTQYYFKLPSPLFGCWNRSKHPSRSCEFGTTYVTSKRK